MNLLLKLMGMVVMAINGSTALHATLPAGIDWTGGECYSLNKIVAGYSGNAIKLIRASDSDQEEFGFTSWGEFDAASWAAWVSGTTSKVVEWPGQSGNGFNATQTVDVNRPLFQLGQNGKPCIVFGLINYASQLFLNLPVGIANNVRSLTQITVGRCIDEYPGPFSAPVWPAFGVGTLFSDFGANGGVVEITSPQTMEGFFNRSLNGLPSQTLAYLPSVSRMEAIGFQFSGTGAAGDTRYVTSTCRDPKTLTGAISAWENLGVPQMPLGGRLGSRGDGGDQSQAECSAMILARGGSVLQTEAMMLAIKKNFGLRSGAERYLFWVGDSLSAAYEGGFDFKGRSPGVLCDALQNSHYVHTFASSADRIDEMDTACANATGGIDQWLSALNMPGEPDVLMLGGANDFQAGASLATVQARCLAFIANRRAAGAGRLFIPTLPEGGAYYPVDADRLAYNAWLPSSGADGVPDLAALDWTGKLQGDGIHWTQAGNAMAAQAVADFLTAL